MRGDQDAPEEEKKMVLKPAKLMEERMKEMLTRDNAGVGEGFSAALSGDVGRVLGDYFELVSRPAVKVARGEDGAYELTVTARASAVKRFRTTEELPSPVIPS